MLEGGVVAWGKPVATWEAKKPTQSKRPRKEVESRRETDNDAAGTDLRRQALDRN